MCTTATLPDHLLYQEYALSDLVDAQSCWLENSKRIAVDFVHIVLTTKTDSPDISPHDKGMQLSIHIGAILGC